MMATTHQTLAIARAIEPERLVLGCILRSPNSLCEIATILRPTDFQLYAHSLIYRLAVARWNENKPIDSTFIAGDLSASNQIEDIGGYGYLGELLQAVSTEAAAREHAKSVRDASIVRQLEIAGSDIVQIARSHAGNAEETLAEAEQRVLAVAAIGSEGKTVSSKISLPRAIDAIDERTRANRHAVGLTTGLAGLDSIVGGWRPQQLVILGARTSTGKTAMAVNAMRAAIKTGANVYCVSLEQSSEELNERCLIAEADVDSWRVAQGLLDTGDADKLLAAADRLGPGTIEFASDQKLTMASISANARRLKRRPGIGLIIVDYVQLVWPEDRRQDRYVQIGETTRRLKALAKELNVPVLALAQLNRDADNGDEPRLRDLRESGSLEQDADTVILLHRIEDCGSYATVQAIVAKQRNGPTGRCELAFIKHAMRFEDSGIPK